ncbi:MAG: protein-L-isoaspartate O-methyltransferase [Sphingomicrobium sp.]
MTDDFAAARRAMVAGQLRPEGVTEAAVLGAMGRVPREDYVPAAFKPMAYMDRSQMIGGAPMMAPAELGRLLSEIAPQVGERALIIGAGGEYSAAVLAAIGLSVDRAPSLDSKTKGRYDVILVEGAVPKVPSALIDALSDTGRIGAAVLDRGVARLSIGRRNGSHVGFRSVADAQVPLLPGSLPEPAFQF